MTIEEILRNVKTQHNTPDLQYNFSEEALAVYKKFHDELNEEMMAKDVFDENDQRSVISKMAVS